LILFGIPNEKERRNDYTIDLPYGARLIVTRAPEAAIKGIEAVEVDPPVLPVFLSFRVMVGMGLLMLLVSWYGTWTTRKGRSTDRWLLWVFAAFTFSGWIATLAGWITTEVGRQPWMVQGMLL